MVYPVFIELCEYLPHTVEEKNVGTSHIVLWEEMMPLDDFSYKIMEIFISGFMSDNYFCCLIFEKDTKITKAFNSRVP